MSPCLRVAETVEVKDTARRIAALLLSEPALVKRRARQSGAPRATPLPGHRHYHLPAEW
jgi:hypothetical protein